MGLKALFVELGSWNGSVETNRRFVPPGGHALPARSFCEVLMGSVIKKRRKRMAKKKHRKLLRKTRHQRRNKK
jgi:hypothetical protein